MKNYNIKYLEHIEYDSILHVFCREYDGEIHNGIGDFIMGVVCSNDTQIETTIGGKHKFYN